jgi:hypothetical protein
MAGTAYISSTFVIQFVPSNTAATTITNPGRAFRVIGIAANNSTGGGLNLTVTDGASNIAATQAIGANSYAWADITAANCEISASENLVVTCSGTGLDLVEILCVATGGGQQLTAT